MFPAAISVRTVSSDARIWMTIGEPSGYFLDEAESVRALEAVAA